MSTLITNLLALKPDFCGAVTEIAALTKSAGGRALIVGGAVRDMLLGDTSVKDVDIEVFGVPPDRLQSLLEKSFALDPCGVSFGILKLRHFDIDVAIPRRETKRGTGHKGFLVDSDPTLSVRDAAIRRDFTINALYYDPLENRLEDPFGGAADLEKRILRHVSEKFSEDPLRVLRGMQFVARFNLTPAPETIALCQGISREGLPEERLFGEWQKLLLKGLQIGKGLEFLRQTGWVRLFPELAALIGCPQDAKWHPEGDVWNHTCLCLDAFARNRTGDDYEDLVVGLAVLCHDFGKPATTRFQDGHLRSLGHDEAGVAPTLSFLRRLTREERLLRDVPPLVQCHMQPFALWRAKAGDAAVRRLAAKVVRIDRLLRVARADDQGRPPEKAGGTSAGEDLRWLSECAERLRVAAEAPKPILMGRHLIEMGYEPSKRFGEWLAAAYEAQLDGKFADLDGAKSYFRENNSVY